MNWRRSVLPFIIIVLSIQIKAQDNPVELGNVTITSSLLIQQQKETGRNITVIKGEQFQKLAVHSLDDLLRYLPGVEIQQRGPQGSQSDINIRGGTFQQVLVIVDGVKLNDPLTGHFSSYIPIQPGEIERVEVLKGAASAIYGSEAVGGVINIVTKTFAAAKQDQKHSFIGGVAAGEYGMFNGNAHYRYSGNQSQFSAGFISNNADGQPLRGTRSFFHLTSGGLAFSQQFKKDWRLSIRTAADSRRFNAQNYYTTFVSDTAKEEVNSWWTQLNISKKTKKGLLTADAAWKKLRDQYWFRPSSAPNDNKTNFLLTQVNYTATLSKQMSMTTGVQVQRKEISSNDRGDHQLWHGALFAILRQRLGDRWYLNESLRLDWDESYGLILVPQLNIAWSPSRWNFRASVGRSVRDADFTERYNNYNKILVSSGRIGNPDLQAEEAWNAEIGSDYILSPSLKISSTVFYRTHTGLIDWAPTPYANMPRQVNLSPAGSYALAKNVEKVKTSGLELDLVYSKKLNKRSDIFLMMGYTWLHSTNKDSIPSFYISTHANHLLNFSAVYNWQQFSVSVNGLYKNRNTQSATAIKASITPSYYVMNLKLGYRLPGKFGRIFIQADNLFNKTYSDLLGSQMPGRWLSGGFDIKL
ncbi:MAG: TonB-dependent receptor [Bacteroidetes bacterium]|nr:TonB-dependent receptor [Bacteroidota bacterium]